MLALVNSRSNASGLKLQLGSGTDILLGYINLDKANLKGVDVVHDLNDYPYPFEDNSFDEVFADAILEHVDDLVKTLEELYRICRDGAVLKVKVPYWNSTILWADPTHKRGFTLDTFTYFEEGSPRGYYGKLKLKILHQRAVPSAIGRFIPNPFRRWLAVFLCNILEGIHAELRVVKR